MSNDPVADLTASLETLDLGKYDKSGMPKRWLNDRENPGLSIDKLHADWSQIQALYEAQDLPCHRVIEEEDGTISFQPRMYANPQVAQSKKLRPELDIKFVVLCREGPYTGESTEGRYVVHKTNGEERSETEFKAVPEEEAEALKTDGWEAWRASRPAYNLKMDYKDTRKPNLDRPVDVQTIDKPVKDGGLFLARGLDFAAKSCTKGNWKPGDLIGKDGSDDAVKAQSASFAPPDCWDKITEPRSATSTGHNLIHERPPSACVGWGAYDKWNRWQASGRSIPKNMVKAESWSTTLDKAVEFVHEDDDDDVKTVGPTLDALDYPSSDHATLTLYETLTTGNKRRLKKKEDEKMVWPGTRKDTY